MSDIFQIKGINAVLRIGEKDYKFADPKYLQKIQLRKKYMALDLQRSSLDPEDVALQTMELNKEQIRLYLPDLEDGVLDSMGDFSFTALLKKLLEITQDTFGAVVEKVEGKS